MARQPRFALPWHPQHVIQRGNNRDRIFADDRDYLVYLETLEEACVEHDCLVHAYVLMSNHVHILITPGTEIGISKAMQSLGRRYVQYFNRRYRRTGTLWEGRYKATLLDTDRYLLTCYRYIELNPVRAGMVETPADYRWSSYRYNALGFNDPLIAPHELYLKLGDTGQIRQEAYRKLFVNGIDQSDLSNIREATNKAWVLGNNRFKAHVQRLLERQAGPRLRGGDRKSEAFRAARKINRV